MPWYTHMNYYIFFETKQSIFKLSFKHPDYLSGTAECWYGQSSLGQEQSQGWEHPLIVYAANIQTSEQKVGLANSNLILLANIWVCPSTLHSNAGFITH